MILGNSKEGPHGREATGEAVVAAGSGRFRVWGQAWATGDGVVLGLFGGERAHVGSVVMGVPRPSLLDPDVVSCTSSVLNLPGHKEEELLRPLVEEAVRRLRQPVVGVAGIHIEAATAEDLAILCTNARAVFQGLLVRLEANRPPW